MTPIEPGGRQILSTIVTSTPEAVSPPMRTLVAVDLSEASAVALEQAKSLIQLSGEPCALSLCHVIPAMHDTSVLFPEEHQEAVVQLVNAEHELKLLIGDRLKAMLGDTPGEIFLEQGSPHSECVKRADNWKADLIVVGCHAKTDLEHAFLGSTAERIVRYAHCSVLVARKTPAPTSRVVLAATDLSDNSLPVIRAGAIEATRRNARLVVLTAVDWSAAAWLASVGAPFGVAPTLASTDLQRHSHQLLMDTLAQALSNIGAIGEPRVIEGPAATCIVSCAEELQAELVVVGTHGKTGLSRLALGSVAETVIQNCTRSVLVVRMAKAA